MSALKTIKDYIKTIFYTNGAEEITGQTSQDGLINLIDAVGAAQFKGLATPSTNPGTALNGQHQFYISSTPGYYIHFGFSILANELVALMYNHSINAWEKKLLATLSSGGGSSVITYTVAELQTAIDNEALIAGSLYVITDADPDLYGGTEIYLQAISATELNTEGIAKVLVPKYESIDIWISGGTYTAEDHVAWGGNVWENKTGAAGTATDIFTLDATNWELVDFNETDYRIVTPVIRYDLLHDKILYMCEKNTIEVSMTMESLAYAETSYYNPIKAMRWGTCDSDIFDSVFTDIRITDSYFETINLPYIRIEGIYMNQHSVISGLAVSGTNTEIRYLNMVNSAITEMTLSNSSELASIYMQQSEIYLGTLSYGSISGGMIRSSIYSFEITGAGAGESISSLNQVNLIDSVIIQFKLTGGNDVTTTTWERISIDYIDGAVYGEIPHYSNQHLKGTLPTATTYDTILVKDGDEVKEIEVGDLGITSDLVNDTTPQLGGNLDLNGKCIDYGAILSTNGTFEGELMTVTVDTNSVGFGALLAQGTDFNFDEADADAVANCYGLVMAVETGTGSKKALLKGQICNTDWNWSAGFIYASTTQGTLTQTKPTGTDDVNVIVGWALSADTMFFAPYLYYQERT